MILRRFYMNAERCSPWHRSALTFEGRWVCDAYKDVIRNNISIPGVWQFEVVWVPDIRPAAPKLVGGSLEIHQRADIAAYFDEPLGRRKIMLNDSLRDACLAAARHLGIAGAVFTKCHRHVVDSGFLRSWVAHRCLSRDRKLTAAIECVHDIDTFRLYALLIVGKNEQVRRRLVLDARPDSLCFRQHIGKIKWVNKNEFEVRDREGQKLAKYHKRDFGGAGV